MHKLILPVFLFTALSLGLLLSNQALAWETSQSASTDCTGSEARIDWTFSNKESSRSISLKVKDNQTLKESETVIVNANETLTGSFKGGAELSDGVVTFNLTWADNNKESDTRTANYGGIECEEKSDDVLPVTTSANDNLPNTGPLQSIGIFTALTASSLGAWYTTRKEVFKALKG